MNINWIVRIKNKSFWVSIIPAVIILIELVARIFGIELKLDGLADELIELVKVAFMILAILGIVNDPTTCGYNDSDRAMNYKEPN